MLISNLGCKRILLKHVYAGSPHSSSSANLFCHSESAGPSRVIFQNGFCTSAYFRQTRSLPPPPHVLRAPFLHCLKSTHRVKRHARGLVGHYRRSHAPTRSVSAGCPGLGPKGGALHGLLQGRGVLGLLQAGDPLLGEMGGGGGGHGTRKDWMDESG